MADIEQMKQKMNSALDHFSSELKKIRAGRANPDMIKDIVINAYDTKMPIEQLANIHVVDPTLLTVQPWDKTLVPEISKVIQASDLGINPLVDGDAIKLPLPPLTSERREEYVKIMKNKIEEARIQIRQRRKDFLLELEEEKKGGLPEDEVKRIEKQVQEVVDKMNDEIEKIGSAKEQELMSV